MRILLDENIPVDFASQLPGHDVKTVVGLGWSGIKNGELMRRSREVCEVFVTADRGIEFQQNIASFPFAVVILLAQSNRLAHLLPLVPALLSTAASAKPGTLQRVGT